MPDLTKLGSDRATQRTAPTGSPARPSARGTIAVPPGSIDDPIIFVTLPDYSPDRPWQCKWMPKGTALPAQDTACLVEFDNTGASYVTWWEGEAVFPEGGGGGGTSTQSGLWRWTITGTASGQIKVIGASWAAATEVQVAKTNNDGGDTTNILTAIAPGDRFYLQQQNDSTRWGKYQVESAGTDNGTYISFPVSFEDGAGEFPANNAVTVFTVTTPGEPGPPGPPGPMGPGFVWRGVWAYNVQYRTNDVVNYGGAAWIALRDNLFQTCPDHPADWQLYVDRGQPGPSGAAGATGPAGTPGVAGPGVAPGGTTGQVLAKKTATDFDTQWVAQTGGAATAILAGRWNLGSSATLIPANGALTIALGAAGAGNTTGWVSDATSVTVPDTGWYQVNVSGQINNGATAGGGFLAPTYNGGSSSEQLGGTWGVNAVERFSETQTIYLAAGTKVGATIFSYVAGAIWNGGALAISKINGAKGDKGDTGATGATGATGGNATVPLDPWHTVSGAGEPAFGTGWSNYGGGENGAQFRKDPLGKVQLRGLVKGTTATTTGTIFTLPAGYGAQVANLRFPVIANGTPTGYVSVTGTAVVFQLGNSTWVDLSVIEFDTDTVTSMPTGPKGDTGGSATVAMDAVHYVGGAGEPAFLNSWVNYDNSAAAPGTGTQRSLTFRKDPLGKVRLSGTVKGGATATIVFKLPTGYWPMRPVYVSAYSGTGMGYAAVDTAGNVSVGNLTAGTNVNSFVMLDEVEFDIETVTAMPTGPRGVPLRVVSSLPALGVTGDMVLFSGDVWIDNGTAWKRLVYA